MDLFGANPVDVVVLVIVTVSALLALVRGFVAEVLAIVAWIGAIAVTTYGTGPALPYVQDYMGTGLTSMASTIGGLFFGTLAVLSALSYAASRFMRTNHLSAVDRSLGLCFGVARGGVLVCLIYICVVFVFPLPRAGDNAEPNTMQEILMEARLQPALASGAEILKALAPAQTIAVNDLTDNPLANVVKQPLMGSSADDEGENAPQPQQQATEQPQGMSMTVQGGLGSLLGQVGSLQRR